MKTKAPPETTHIHKSQMGNQCFLYTDWWVIDLKKRGEILIEKRLS